MRSCRSAPRLGLRRLILAAWKQPLVVFPGLDPVLRASDAESASEARRCQGGTPDGPAHQTIFRLQEPKKRMRDQAAHACRALCRARVAEELQRRRGTPIAEHLKLVVDVMDRPGP